MKLNQWAIVVDRLDPYKAPEQSAMRLYGYVEGHPHFRNGQDITTSRIIGKTAAGEVKTKSGSIYELGDVSPHYEAEFPNALQRLMSTLPVLP